MLRPEAEIRERFQFPPGKAAQGLVERAAPIPVMLRNPGLQMMLITAILTSLCQGVCCGCCGLSRVFVPDVGTPLFQMDFFSH